MVTEAYIAVSRRSDDLFGMVRKLRVTVDGEPAGHVSHGKRAMFAVMPGEHRVTVSMDWCHSEPMAVRVEAGQTVELDAHSHYKANMLMNLVGIVCWPNRFFVVRPKAEAGGVA